MIAAHLNRVIFRCDLYQLYFVTPSATVRFPNKWISDDPDLTLFRPLLLLLAFSLGAMTNASAQTRDVAGSKDYPGIGRVRPQRHHQAIR